MKKIIFSLTVFLIQSSFASEPTGPSKTKEKALARLQNSAGYRNYISKESLANSQSTVLEVSQLALRGTVHDGIITTAMKKHGSKEADQVKQHLKNSMPDDLVDARNELTTIEQKLLLSKIRAATKAKKDTSRLVEQLEHLKKRSETEQ